MWGKVALLVLGVEIEHIEELFLDISVIDEAKPAPFPATRRLRAQLTAAGSPFEQGPLFRAQDQRNL
jgi:hypothetical protein